MNESLNKKSMWDIFLVFFKIGSFTFGGGYAMIPLIEREIINNKKWAKEEELMDVFAISESVPGAIAINSSICVGYKIAGTMGGIVAALGVILPSLIIITIIASFFMQFKDYLIVQAAFMGIRSAVVGLILMAAIKVGKTAIKDFVTFFIACATVIIMLVFNIHAIYIIILGALVGIGAYFLLAKNIKKNTEKVGSEHDIC